MFYTLFTFLAWLLAAPFLLLASISRKYRKSLPARFFLIKNPPLKPAKIHFHVCSLGEAVAIKNLALKFNDFSVSVITTTGFNAALKFCKNVRFLPFENFLPFWLKKSEILVIFEAELWLNLVRSAKKNGTFVVLLNARMSDRSFKRYKFFKFYYKKVFENIDLVLAQSDKDALRLEILGAENIKITGNIKSANFSKPTKNYAKFKERLIVIASTHEGEEELVLNNLEINQNDKIILAPRHPERFKKAGEILAKYAKKNALKFEKFSQNSDLKSECILLDTLGELVNFYAIADVVILCGSFVNNVGGHNPIEPAYFGAKIISGKYFYNQKALYEIVKNIEICEATEISKAIKKSRRSEILNISNLDEIKKIIEEKNGKSI